MLSVTLLACTLICRTQVEFFFIWCLFLTKRIKKNYEKAEGTSSSHCWLFPMFRMDKRWETLQWLIPYKKDHTTKYLLAEQWQFLGTFLSLGNPGIKEWQLNIPRGLKKIKSILRGPRGILGNEIFFKFSYFLQEKSIFFFVLHNFQKISNILIAPIVYE